MPQISKRPSFKLLLGLAGTVAITAAALSLLDWAALSSAARQIPLIAILACLLFCVATHILIALRWAYLAAVDDGSPKRADVLVMLHASIYNLFTPAAVGADVFRIFRGADRRGGRSRSAGLVFFDRVLGIWGQATVYLMGYVLALGLGVPDVLKAPLPVFLGLVIGSAVLSAVAKRIGTTLLSGRHGRAADIFRNILNAATEHGWRRKLLLALLSFSAVTTWVLAAYALASQLGPQLGLGVIAMIAVVTELARLLPISLQGIGVREVTFAWLSSEAGGSAEVGFVTCGVLYALNYLVVAGLGFAAGVALESWEQQE